MFCQKCGKEIMDEAIVCIHCGCAIEKNTKNGISTNDSDVNGGLVALSIIIPIVGIILWIIKHKETPREAKVYGITGIISWAVAYLILFGVVSTGF
jgi:hypothetical protein